MFVCLWLQGLPYAVAGVGDLLALFRCISCRFSFSTDIMQPRLLGAIGRVYTTSEVTLVALSTRLSMAMLSCAAGDVWRCAKV